MAVQNALTGSEKPEQDYLTAELVGIALKREKKKAARKV